jgi:hypothetical protein
MSNSTDRQFQEADAAVEQTVAAFMGKVEPLLVNWEAVAPTYIVQCLLLTLCREVSKLVDDPVVRDFAGPATVRLSNALADYRDSRSADR